MSALAYLATRDGSDAEGFMAGDEPLAHTLLAWEQSGRELSEAQLASGYRMLSRYTDQLYSAGISYEDIPKPRDLQRAAAETVAARIVASNDESTAPYAYIESGRIMLRSEFRLRPTVKMIPNERWDPKKRRATFPVTAGQAAVIRDALAGLGLRMSDEVTALCAQADVARAGRIIRCIADGTLPDLDWSQVLNKEPWAHQVKAILFTATQMGDPYPPPKRKS
jgi:hypothetical protein